MEKELWKPPPKWQDAFSKNIRMLRLQRDLKQREIGEFFEVDAATVTGWETGKSRPNLHMFIKICEYFGRSPDEMISEQLDKNRNGGGGRASPPLSREPEASKESDATLHEKLKELEERLQKLELVQTQ